MMRIDGKTYICTLDYGIELIKGKWKALAICHLDKKPQRFSELQKKIGNVSQKVFTQGLKELERDGIIKRKVFPELPPRVEYTLTEQGKLLFLSLDMLKKWTDDYIETVQKKVEIVTE